MLPAGDISMLEGVLSLLPPLGFSVGPGVLSGHPHNAENPTTTKTDRNVRNMVRPLA